MRKVLLLLMSFTGCHMASAQKQISSDQQAWFGYFNQTRFSNHWGIWADLHLRTREDFVSRLNQAIARAGLTYYITANTKVTAGYAYVNNFPGDNHKNISQPEHRIWQQLQWHTNYSRLRLMQWVRLEERFRHNILNNDALAEGYNYTNRVRYNFFLTTPLGQKAFAPKTISVVVNDEVHVNFGRNVVYNTFDQNRFFVGLSYQTSSYDNIQFGYMNVFQQLPAGNQYKNIHAARLFYFHNLDLRKKAG